MLQPEPPPIINEFRIFSPRIMLVIMGVAAVIVLGSSFVVQPLYHQWLWREGRSLAKRAGMAIENERFDEASILLVSAHQKSPADPFVLRTIAQMLTRTGPEQKSEGERAVYFWRQLLATHEDTLDDRMRMGLALVSIGSISEAQKLLDAAPIQERGRRRPLELKSALLRYAGHSAEARQALRASLQTEPENRQCVLHLARMDLDDPLATVQERALQSIWKVAREGGLQGIHAVDTLALSPHLTKPQSNELRALAEKNPGSSERHHFNVLTAWLRLHPDDKKNVVQAEWKAHERQQDSELSEFLQWLHNLGEHKFILGMMKEEQAGRSAEFFQLYADALAGERRWGDLRRMISTSYALPISTTETALLRARCSHGLGESTDAVRSQLLDAMHNATASRNLHSIEHTAQISENLAHPDIAIDSYRTLSATPAYQLAVLEKIFSVQSRNHMTTDSLSTLKEILRLRPGLTPYFNTALYLQLLTGTEMEVAMEKAFALDRTEDNPSEANLHALLTAFAAYRVSDTARLHTLVLEVNATHLPAGPRAVLAGLLQTCGETQKAFAIAEKVPSELLLIEEKRFLKKAF